MKAAFESMPLRGWFLKKPDWLDHQTAVSLTFAVKDIRGIVARPLHRVLGGPRRSDMVISDRLHRIATG